jgi:hypothetical protein
LNVATSLVASKIYLKSNLWMRWIWRTPGHTKKKQQQQSGMQSNTGQPCDPLVLFFVVARHIV